MIYLDVIFSFFSKIKGLHIFKRRTIIIATNVKTKQICISGITQAIIVVCVLAIVGRFIFKYNRYKNYHNYAIVLDENDRLRAEQRQIYGKFAEYDKKAEQINNYLETIVDTSVNVQMKKPDKIDYKVASADEIVNRMTSHEQYAYAVIDARKKYLNKSIKKIGLSGLIYMESDAILKNVFKSEHNQQIHTDDVANISDSEHVGGLDDEVVTSRYMQRKPFLKLSHSKVNDRNFNSELNQMVAVEKTLQSLPFGVPTDDKYRITSTYGLRLDPVKKDGRVRMHRGIDMVLSDGNIHPTKEGVVVFAGVKSGYGKCVDIEHRKEGALGSVITHYAHLDKIFVSQGQYVTKQDVIGIQGNTGQSTGYHLHYEIRINKQPVNPVVFIKTNSVFDL